MDSLRNRKPGQCLDCGRHIPAGEGMLTLRAGRWQVRHLGPEHCEEARERQARESRERHARFIAAYSRNPND